MSEAIKFQNKDYRLLVKDDRYYIKVLKEDYDSLQTVDALSRIPKPELEKGIVFDAQDVPRGIMRTFGDRQEARQERRDFGLIKDGVDSEIRPRRVAIINWTYNSRFYLKMHLYCILRKHAELKFFDSEEKAVAWIGAIDGSF